MKKIITWLLLLVLCSCCALAEEPASYWITDPDSENYETESLGEEWTPLAYTKDSVEEFLSVFEQSEFGSIPCGDECYNVTCRGVAWYTKIRIFKFTPSCDSFALIDGKVYRICESFGGYGFIYAVPWDYDGNGVIDLLITSSCGSGLTIAEISVFDVCTKESILVYRDSPETNTYAPTWNSFCISYLLLSSKEPWDLPFYIIDSAEIASMGGNYCALALKLIQPAGTVQFENGEIVYRVLPEEWR